MFPLSDFSRKGFQENGTGVKDACECSGSLTVLLIREPGWPQWPLSGTGLGCLHLDHSNLDTLFR